MAPCLKGQLRQAEIIQLHINVVDLWTQTVVAARYCQLLLLAGGPQAAVYCHDLSTNSLNEFGNQDRTTRYDAMPRV